MLYIICENCGGYYELQEGESLEDFDSCHCGGRLNYTNSINEIFPDENRYYGKDDNINQNTISCPVCGHLNKKTSFSCSECNSFTRSRTTTKNSSSDRYDYQNVLESYRDNYGGCRGLLKKVNWWGIIIGIIFLIVTWILTSIVLFLGLIHVALQNPNEQGILTFFGGSVLIFVLVLVISGFVGVAATRGRTYPEGIINGGMVGAIPGFFLGGFSSLMALTFAQDIGILGLLWVIPVTLWYIFFYGAMTASGGILAIVVRRHVGII